MAISFEQCWEGCVVDEVITEPLSAVLAFDDGDLKVRTAEQLKQDLAEECLKFIGTETGGIVQNTEGVPAAVRAARHKEGLSAARAVGVLVGDTGYSLAGDTIYESFFVDADAFSGGGRENAGRRRAAAPRHTHCCSMAAERVVCLFKSIRVTEK